MGTKDGKTAPDIQGLVSRNVKDGVFRTLFKEDREALLQLYNALNGTDYADASALEIVTIENAVYIVMKNDLAFVLTDTLNLYEHQSSVNANLPVRFLLYLAEEYQRLIAGIEQSIYGKKQIKLPTPRCVVFYNGEEEQPDRWEMRLSDAFSAKAGAGKADGRGGKRRILDGQEEADAELRVQVYNINRGHNAELLEKCPLLAAYAKFTAVCRAYLSRGMERRAAYEKAVKYCIKHNILKDFLRKNRAEVIGMLLADFDAEKYERTIRQEGVEEGIEQGRMDDARRMLRAGRLSYEEIAEYTALPLEEVQRLAEPMLV